MKIKKSKSNRGESGFAEYERLLDQHRQLALERGIVPDKPLPKANAADYSRHRQKSLRMYAYMNRITSLLLPFLKASPYAFALFDTDGYLLKLAGPEAVLEKLRSDNIEKGSIWDFGTMGPNGVTVGLQIQATLASCGEQNYHRALKEYTIYFSPITLLENQDFDQEALYGGVALISPDLQVKAERLLTVVSLADHIMLLWAQSRHLYNALHESIGYALMTCNVNMYNQRAFIFYYSKNIFDILSVPEADIYIKPVEEFIDPLPKNEVFWDIISNARRVQDMAVTLCVKGKDVSCIITTESFYQPKVNIRSIDVYITTQKKVLANIAQKIGNSAPITFEDIIGESPQMKTAVRKAKMLAHSSANVMILGESGTGKDLFAQAIHNASDRRGKPFIAINCGAIPRDLIASELFGYDRGAFTGAKSQGNIGKFELADGGTIFLDEIGEMPPDLQATLLRAVEQKQFMRIGSNRLVDVDVKIISATNVDIFSMMEEKRFREDLYYRLSTVHLDIPPLRRRGNDIIVLAEYFTKTISRRINKRKVPMLSEEAKALLLEVPWRGNVRELQNLIDCVVQLYDEPVITAEHLRENIQWRYFSPGPESSCPLPKPKTGVKKAVPTADMIIQALQDCGGNRSQAARLLGIDRRALYRYMERLNLS